MNSNFLVLNKQKTKIFVVSDNPDIRKNIKIKVEGEEK